MVKSIHNFMWDGQLSEKPQSWTLLYFNPGYRDPLWSTELFWPHTGARPQNPASAIRVGRYSMADYVEGFVSEAELREEAERVIGDAPWERIGEAMLSRDAIEMFDAHHPMDLVVAFFLIQHEEHHWFSSEKHGFFAFIDGSARMVLLSTRGKLSQEYLDFTAADRSARAELGLNPPPDYAALIREYVAEMKNK